MTRNASDGSLASVRAELLGADDDERWLELGDIQALDPDDEAEPVLARGSNIHMLDGRELGPVARTETLGELDSMLLRYLVDVDP